jgi:hypothetical protein
MFHPKFQRAMCALALAGAVGCAGSPVHAGSVKKVFVIAMENHNWTQPSTQELSRAMLKIARRSLRVEMLGSLCGLSNSII